MKLFLDSANLSVIETVLKAGYVQGVTTNPSLLSKEPKGSYLTHMKSIVALLKKHGAKNSLSVEVFSNDPETILAQAKEFTRKLAYKNLAIKIPVSYGQRDNLDVIHALARSHIAVNCTACMTPLQAMMAAAAGARYVSIFYHRLLDGGKDPKFSKQRKEGLESGLVESSDFNPDQVIAETRKLLASYPDTEIIAGSFRSPVEVKHAGLAGSHIVTVPPTILKASLFHYKTDEAVERFLADFSDWIA